MLHVLTGQPVVVAVEIPPRTVILRRGLGLTKLWQILRARLLRFHFFAIGTLGAC
jgi:uncharacterized membrane protein YqaE (UPF0057 family)